MKWGHLYAALSLALKNKCSVNNRSLFWLTYIPHIHRLKHWLPKGLYLEMGLKGSHRGEGDRDEWGLTSTGQKETQETSLSLSLSQTAWHGEKTCVYTVRRCPFTSRGEKPQEKQPWRDFELRLPDSKTKQIGFCFLSLLVFGTLSWQT